MRLPLNNNRGFVLAEVLAGIGFVAGLAILGYLLFFRSSTPTTLVQPKPTSNNSNLYAVLSPATVSSKVPECSQPISYSSDGNLGPITCPDGYLNITAWKALAALEPKVMALGYNVSLAQVQSALCTDATNSNSDANTNYSNVIEQTTYQISALYYGWSFPSNPAIVLTNGTC